MNSLSNLLIVDLSRLVPGPLCSHVLSEMGAHVIKIEDEANADYLQYIPPLLKNKKGAMYTYLNRYKRIQKMCLKDSSDHKLLVSLIQKADVLIETFRPGVLKKLGLNPKSLLKMNKQLIIASISGYGAEGILSQKAGHDLNYQGLSGLLKTHKAPKTLWADLVGGGYYAAMSILAALYERTLTKKGRHLDISLTQGLGYLKGLSLFEFQAGEVNQMLDGSLARYRVYTCRDGRQIAFAALEDKFWNAWCQLFNYPEWIDQGGQYPDRDPLIHEKMESVFLGRSYNEWVKLLKNTDFCVTPVLSEDELLDPKQAFKAVSTENLADFKVPSLFLGKKVKVRANWQNVLKKKKIPPLLMKKLLKESKSVAK